MAEVLFCNDYKEIKGISCKVVGSNGSSRIVQINRYNYIWPTQISDFKTCPYRSSSYVVRLSKYFGSKLMTQFGHADGEVQGLLQKILGGDE